MQKTASSVKFLLPLFTILSLVINPKNVNGQPQPFPGTLFFNLTEKEHSGNFLSPEELESKNIKILSYDSVTTQFRYDTIHNSFSVTTDGFERKVFAISFNSDTIIIDYPAKPFANSVCIISPIPLNGRSFSFYNKLTYDALHSNHNRNKFNIFYFCLNCSITDTYAMPEERKAVLKKQLPPFYEVELRK